MRLRSSLLINTIFNPFDQRSYSVAPVPKVARFSSKGVIAGRLIKAVHLTSQPGQLRPRLIL